MLTTPKDAYIPQQFKVLVYSIVDAQPFPLFIQNCYRTSNLHKVLDYLTGISLPSSLQDQWVGEDTLIIFVFYDTKLSCPPKVPRGTSSSCYGMVWYGTRFEPLFGTILTVLVPYLLTAQSPKHQAQTPNRQPQQQPAGSSAFIFISSSAAK